MIDLDVRLMGAGDLEWFHLVRSDPETFKYLHSGRAFSLAETKEWFNVSNPLFWVVSQAGVPIGYFRTNHVDYMTGSIQIGMDIASEHRGRGLAKPAYEQFIHLLETHLFKTFTLGGVELQSSCYSLVRKVRFHRKISCFSPCVR